VPRAKYAGFEALNPWFEVVQEGLDRLVDGDHFFDMFADRCSLRVPIQASRLAYENPRTS